MVPKRAAESDAELKIFFADPERIKEIAIYLVSPGSPPIPRTQAQGPLCEDYARAADTPSAAL